MAGTPGKVSEVRMEVTPALLAQLLSYDPETGRLTWLPRPKSFFATEGDWSAWHKNFCGRPAMESPTRGYLQGTLFGKAYRAHRVCWAIAYGKWPDHTIDHINGRRNDNRLANLRDVPIALNARNKGLSSNNTSGVNGVRWFKLRGKWEADIQVDGKLIHLGLFERLDDAVAARLAANDRYAFSERHGAAA
jgi:hypothetical protein